MSGSPSALKRSKMGWNVLLIALTVEALLLAWVVFVSVAGVLGSDGAYVQGVSLVIMAVASCIWVVATLIALVRSRASWVRGSSLTIHVLLFAAGTGCLQLDIGPVWFGFGLTLLAVIGFAAAMLARPALADPNAHGNGAGASVSDVE